MLNSKDNEQIKLYQYPKNQQYKAEDIKGLTALNEEEEEDENSIGVLSELPSESDSSDEDGQQMMMRRANLLYDHEDNERIADAKNTGDEPLTGHVEVSYNPEKKQTKPAEKNVSHKRVIPESKENINNLGGNTIFNNMKDTNNVLNLQKSEVEDGTERTNNSFDIVKQKFGKNIDNLKNEAINKSISLGYSVYNYGDKNFPDQTERLFVYPVLKNEKLFKKLKDLGYSKFPDAAELFDMSYSDHYMDTEFTRKNTVLNSYKDAPPVLRDYFKDKIIKQVGENHLKDTKGIFIDAGSESSKRLAKSEYLLNFLRDNKQEIKEYGKIDEGSLEFKDDNWGYALGKADIQKLIVLPNGDISMYVTDTLEMNNDDPRSIVKGARRLQDENIIKPFFACFHVKIDKKTADKYLE